MSKHNSRFSAKVRRKLNPIIANGLTAFRARVPLSGSEWADRFFYLSPESSGTEGRWRCYPYQTALINWMTCDDIEEVNIMKSRRIGYTKCLMAATGCLIEQKARNIAIWQPTDGDAKDFVTDEIEPMLRDCDVLGKRLKCQVGMKSKYNTIDKKVFHGATLDIKGGKSARNFRRMTKDVAVYDECDAFDYDIDGEGSCFELGDGRLDQAPFPKSIRGSTPKTKGMSMIETAVENSDMVVYRFVKCPDCGTMQRLEFARLKWEQDKPETVYYECLNGCILHYKQYPAMDEAGRWQTVDGYYYDETTDRFYDAEDNVVPKPRKIGVKIWAGYSYLRSWQYIVEKWLEANKNARNGNTTTLKAVINTLLGETFEEHGESVDADALNTRGEDYLMSGKIPNDILVITCGVDVQGGLNSRLELEIVGHGLEDETWSLDYIVLPGDPERQAVWDNLDQELARRFVRDDGVILPISATFIDSGYLPTEVYRYTAPRRKNNVFATKGVVTGTICNAGTWQGEKKNKTRAILRTCNVNDAKTIVFHRLKIQEPGQGFCHFPGHYPDKYFTRLTNEEKVEERKKGVLVGYKWIKKGPNEPLDCRCYALAAKEYLNINLNKLRLRLQRQATMLYNKSDNRQERAKVDNYTEQVMASRQQRRKGSGKKGWLNSWRKR